MIGGDAEQGQATAVRFRLGFEPTSFSHMHRCSHAARGHLAVRVVGCTAALPRFADEDSHGRISKAFSHHGADIALRTKRARVSLDWQW